VDIRLAYGKKGLDISLPDELNVDVVGPKYLEGFTDQAAAVREALRNPIASRPLKELVQPSDRVGIVLNDITRPTPYRIVLPALLDELAHVPTDQIVLFIATGTHRANMEAELREMVGDEVVTGYRIIQNNARDPHSHMLVGTTKSGNDVYLHKEYLRCDVRILTGFIEPHFFAGFSGGGKACMPGLAGLQTVLKNHCPENIDNPAATWGRTAGNPVWQEIREAASMLPPAFLLNVTLNRDKQITAVFAGDLEKAHQQGCAFVKENAMVKVLRYYDIVITSNSGYPLDLNLYQSVKAMSAASRVLKAGGSIIVAADCADGIPEHGEYGKLLSQATSAESLLQEIRSGAASEYLGIQRPCQDTWQAQIHAQIIQKVRPGRIYVYSRNLSDEQIRSALLEPCHDIEATVSRLLESYGPTPGHVGICVLPEGPQTVPFYPA